MLTPIIYGFLGGIQKIQFKNINYTYSLNDEPYLILGDYKNNFIGRKINLIKSVIYYGELKLIPETDSKIYFVTNADEYVKKNIH